MNKDEAYILYAPFDSNLSSIDYVSKYYHLISHYKKLVKIINNNDDEIMYLYNIKNITGKTFRQIYFLIEKLRKEQ